MSDEEESSEELPMKKPFDEEKYTEHFDSKTDIIEHEPCPFCGKKELTMMEQEIEIPYFGKMHVFGMKCNACGVRKADVEADAQQPASKFTFEVDGDEDLKVRIVKSSEGIVKIPHVANIEPGPASNGYITNVEGLIMLVKHQIETLRDSSEDLDDKEKAKNLIKKLDRVLFGRDKLKIIIEDPTGNSAIISPKAVKSKL